MPARISNLAPNTLNGFLGNMNGKDPPAFTILQKDGLESSLPLLQLDLEDEDCEKTSARTMTLSRNGNNDFHTRRRISKSNDHLVLANLQSHQSNPVKIRQQSKSHGNLKSDDNSSDQGKSSIVLSTEDFNEVLNAKLKRIQEQEEEEQSRRLAKKNQVIHPKPFITTVKTGEFLMPPPEVAALLGITPSCGYGNVLSESNDETDFYQRTRFRHLVSLNKRPEVRYNSHNARCPAALKATEDFYYLPTNASSITTASSMDEQAKRIKRSDFTNADHSAPFGNIMFDRRVARGSNFASAPAFMECEQSEALRHSETRRREMSRRKIRSQASKALLMRIGSPPPVPGRKHEPVQTDLYLEELFEKPDESEVATQTDYFLDRPSTPIYCPGKTGQDVCTQIEAGDLFDYDVEVQPILEVLVGKTIEQALVEVLEEEEIAALREQQRKFLELRAAELAETQRLEEQERRLREEKCRRLREHEEATKVQQETEERVAATVLLTGYIAELLPTVLEGLKMSGFLLDEIKADVEEGFMPWLMKEVKKEVGTMIESRELLMEIIKEILENRSETYKRLGEEYDASRVKSREMDEDEGEVNQDNNSFDQDSISENPDVN